MSDHTRLNKGFVNWQEHRVFVPWLGAPRIVPAVDDEVRILRIRSRMDVTIAMISIPLCAVGVWLGNPWTFAAAALGVTTAVGAGMLLLRRHIRQWPRLVKCKFGRFRFMFIYFRSRRIRERVDAFGWGVLGLAVSLNVFSLAVSDLMTTVGDGWFVARLALALLGPGLWTFLAGRHATLALLSLLPLASLRIQIKALASK